MRDLETVWKEFEQDHIWQMLMKSLFVESPDTRCWMERGIVWARACLRADLDREMRGLPRGTEGAFSLLWAIETLIALRDGPAFDDLNRFVLSIPGVEREIMPNREPVYRWREVSSEQTAYLDMTSITWRTRNDPLSVLRALGERERIGDAAGSAQSGKTRAGAL